MDKPVENITTWHLDQALKLNSESCLSPLEYRAKLRGSAFLEFLRLHGALLEGSQLPAQWPQSKELEELRTELAALRKAMDDRRTVEGWCAEHGCRLELEFNEDSKRTVFLSIASGELEFSGEYPSIDEAFAAAAEWVRGQS